MDEKLASVRRSKILIQLDGVDIVLHLPSQRAFALVKRQVLFGRKSSRTDLKRKWNISAFVYSPDPSLYGLPSEGQDIVKRQVSVRHRRVLVLGHDLRDIARDVYHAIFWDVLKRQLESRGWLCVHASMVWTSRGALVFIGPKGAGKTTLMILASRRKAQILSNDIVFLRVVNNKLSALGVATPLVNMKSDSLGHLVHMTDQPRVSERNDFRNPPVEVKVDLRKINGSGHMRVTNEPVPVYKAFFSRVVHAGRNRSPLSLESRKVSQLLDTNMWKYDKDLVNTNVASDDYYTSKMAISKVNLPNQLQRTFKRVSGSSQFYMLELPAGRFEETSGILDLIMN